MSYDFELTHHWAKLGDIAGRGFHFRFSLWRDRGILEAIPSLCRTSAHVFTTAFRSTMFRVQYRKPKPGVHVHETFPVLLLIVEHDTRCRRSFPRQLGESKISRQSAHMSPPTRPVLLANRHCLTTTRDRSRIRLHAFSLGSKRETERN